MSILLIRGDARSIPLADQSVNCVVTSPPYWRQRNYKISGQIGLEQAPEVYCASLVQCFREVRRVLRDDGTLWLNLGDKWASGGNGGGGSFMENRQEAWAHAKDAKGWRSPPAGYKDKDLVGIPWMVAFALRDDGWYLRQCNIWAKPNCMPESVTDRSTVSHEYIFQLSKSNDYFYNSDLARTPPMPSTETRLAQDVENQTGSERANGQGKTNGTMKAVRRSDKERGHSRRHNRFNDRWDAMSEAEQMANGANLRSVWWVSPAQTTDDHYAVMPEQIARICILAGCPAGGTVFDPFCGSGTSLLVARNLQCHAIGMDLNEAYLAIAQRRLRQEVFDFSAVPSSR